VEGEVEDNPELLAQGGEFRVLHPVEVDEEDEADCCCRCGDDADDLRVCGCLSAHDIKGREGDLLQASGFFTIVTMF
jgi:hypothetical protein